MRKNKQHLVCQYLENVSSQALEQYQSIIRKYVQRRSGIYALYRKEKIYYVGLASNLRSRLKSHLRDRHHGLWDRFSVYLTIGDDHIRELESLILRIAKPKGNKVKGKFRMAQDLRRQLAKDIRVGQKRELSALLGKQFSDMVIPSGEKKRAHGRAAKYITRSYKLKAVSRGKTLWARLRRDGRIKFKGKIYRSPSQAGWEAVRRRHGVNGWSFWTFERAPGDWVPIDELRRK